ncbi:cell division protein ZapA [uncultured Gemmiger sp.]|uniref:cell division protein ZapA n=1 Tax=uncultured Gemmiger sp. TaxID=1623490 RepID=UPI0025E2177B|nr:cell division protein ZapA [uncultured Gemmiger sp.]
MGMTTSKVRLEICGSSYVVNTTESAEYMQNLADRLNLDMNELMSSSKTVSITTAAVMTALSYRDELEKASGSADNMRRQIKNYLEDAATSKMAAEELRRENASLQRRIDELKRRMNYPDAELDPKPEQEEL